MIHTGDREIGVISRIVGMYVYEVDQELGGGESSSSACPEAGNRPPEKKKNGKSPEVCLEGEGMVTGQIEPCIIRGRCLIGGCAYLSKHGIVSMSLVNSDPEFVQTCQGQM